MIESLCGTAENNTTLYSTMSVKKLKLKKKKTKRKKWAQLSSMLHSPSTPGLGLGAFSPGCTGQGGDRPVKKQAVKIQQRFSVRRRSSEVAGQPMAVSPTSPPASCPLNHSPDLCAVPPPSRHHPLQVLKSCTCPAFWDFDSLQPFLAASPSLRRSLTIQLEIATLSPQTLPTDPSLCIPISASCSFINLQPFNIISVYLLILFMVHFSLIDSKLHETGGLAVWFTVDSPDTDPKKYLVHCGCSISFCWISGWMMDGWMMDGWMNLLGSWGGFWGCNTRSESQRICSGKERAYATHVQSWVNISPWSLP